MSYTVWSHGRLVGHSALEFVYREDGHRMGTFHPAEGAEGLIEIATGGTAVLLSARREGTLGLETHAAYTAALQRCEALALELRDMSGRVIPCESVAIKDCEMLIAFSEVADAESEAYYESLDEDARARLDADIEHDAQLLDEELEDEFDEPWRPEVEHERYQLQIRLVDHDAIP
jgi:hypothetical protein